MERSPEQIVDELLVLRWQEGNAAAVEAMVERWQPRLWRHACRLLGRRDVASDITQEAWIAIVKGIGRLRDPACFRRWAFLIVTRKCADWIRVQQRQRDVLRQVPVPPEEADDASADGDEIERLRWAMKRLPEERRVLLAMFYREQMSLHEIADILEIPVGTVKSRLYHAREELREVIERSQ
ncbi:RNA polymerase sigma factor [Planctomycetes bacterium Pan216]